MSPDGPDEPPEGHPADAAPEPRADAGDAPGADDLPDGSAASESSSGRPAEGDVPGQEPGVEGEPGPSAAEATRPFQPAPRLAAPFRPATVPRGFAPERGMVLGVAVVGESDARGKGKRGFLKRRARKQPVEGAVEEVFVDADRTATWVYYVILALSLGAFFVGYLYWNSSSIGAGWRLGFLVEMILFAIIVLVVATRLGRRQDWRGKLKRVLSAVTLGLFFAIRDFVVNFQQAVLNAGRGLADSGEKFRSGFGDGGRPNFVVRMIRGVVRFVIQTLGFVVRTILGVFKLIAWVWATVVRLGWAIVWGIVWPVVSLALRILRWALRVTWRVARWAVRLSWRIVYFVLRRFPIKYATNWARPHVQRAFEPRLLTLNVLVSDLLLAPVKEEDRERAEPFVDHFQRRRQVRLAGRLVETRERYALERPSHLRIMTSADRAAARAEAKQHRKDERQRAKDEAKAEKERVKEETARLKEAIKDAKAKGEDAAVLEDELRVLHGKKPKHIEEEAAAPEPDQAAAPSAGVEGQAAGPGAAAGADAAAGVSDVVDPKEARKRERARAKEIQKRAKLTSAQLKATIKRAKRRHEDTRPLERKLLALSKTRDPDILEGIMDRDEIPEELVDKKAAKAKRKEQKRARRKGKGDTDDASGAADGPGGDGPGADGSAHDGADGSDDDPELVGLSKKEQKKLLKQRKAEARQAAKEAKDAKRDEKRASKGSGDAADEKDAGSEPASGDEGDGKDAA